MQNKEPMVTSPSGTQDSSYNFVRKGSLMNLTYLLKRRVLKSNTHFIMGTDPQQPSIYTNHPTDHGSLRSH